MELGAKVTISITDEKVVGQGFTARRQCKVRSLVYKWMLQQDGMPSHITRSTACVKVS